MAKKSNKGFLENKKGIQMISITSNQQELWKKCEELEYKVFRDCDYIPENPMKRLTDYDAYNAHTEILAALSGTLQMPYEERQLVGILRVITAPHKTQMEDGLFPTIDARDKLHLYPERLKEVMKLDPRKVLDMASMVIAPDMHDSRASSMLCTRVTTRCWEIFPLRYGIAAIDTPFYRKLKDRGYPYQDLGPSTMYWGSMTTATIVDSMAVPIGLQRLAIPYFRLKGLIKGDWRV